MAVHFDPAVEIPRSGNGSLQPHEDGLPSSFVHQSVGDIGSVPTPMEEILARRTVSGPGGEQGFGLDAEKGPSTIHPQSQVQQGPSRDEAIAAAVSNFDAFTASLGDGAYMPLGTLLAALDAMVREWVDLAQPFPGIEVPEGLESLWERMTREDGLYHRIESHLTATLAGIPQEDAAGLAAYQAALGKTLYGLQKYEKAAHEGGIWAPDFSPWEATLTRADERIQESVQSKLDSLAESSEPREVLQDLRVVQRTTKGYPQRFMKMASPDVARVAAESAKAQLSS